MSKSKCFRARMPSFCATDSLSHHRLFTNLTSRIEPVNAKLSQVVQLIRRGSRRFHEIAVVSCALN